MTSPGAIGLLLLCAAFVVGEQVIDGATVTFEKIDKPEHGSIRSCRETSYTGKVVLKLNSSLLLETVCIQGHRGLGDGWMVMQQRVGSSADSGSWDMHRVGFGSLDRSFWVGLESIYHLTKATPHELAIELIEEAGEYSLSRYDRFEIGSELEKYSLKGLGRYSGSPKDFLSVNKGCKFSTFDVDNDINLNTNCALKKQGSRWYNQGCSNLLIERKYIFVRMLLREIDQ